MIINEQGDVFQCDCGFSWRRGHSGSHDCAEGLRVQRAELLAALEQARGDIGKLPTPIFTDARGKNHLVGSPMPLMRVMQNLDAAIAKAKGGAS